VELGGFEVEVVGGQAVATLNAMTDGECNSPTLRHAFKTNGTSLRGVATASASSEYDSFDSPVSR
jgi:hypothetical protein